MPTTIPGWTTLAEDPAVLVREYTFGAGRANAMAVGLPDRKWMIVSPPPKMSAAEAEAFCAYGSVVALLENNGTHHMGLGPCRALFPQAVSYATELAGARIRKKNKEPGELKPIEALRPLLGSKIAVVPIDGSKVGDVIVRVQADSGNLLYASDFIANILQLPPNFLFRWVFKLTDSGPGLKVFGVFFKFFVADGAAARAGLIKEIETSPPTILVPAHGAIEKRQDLAPTLIGMLRAV